jgi:hypothetical protein
MSINSAAARPQLPRLASRLAMKDRAFNRYSLGGWRCIPAAAEQIVNVGASIPSCLAAVCRL